MDEEEVKGIHLMWAGRLRQRDQELMTLSKDTLGLIEAYMVTLRGKLYAEVALVGITLLALVMWVISGDIIWASICWVGVWAWGRALKKSRQMKVMLKEAHEATLDLISIMEKEKS